MNRGVHSSGVRIYYTVYTQVVLDGVFCVIFSSHLSKENEKMRRSTYLDVI